MDPEKCATPSCKNLLRRIAKSIGLVFSDLTISTSCTRSMLMVYCTERVLSGVNTQRGQRVLQQSAVCGCIRATNWVGRGCCSGCNMDIPTPNCRRPHQDVPHPFPVCTNFSVLQAHCKWQNKTGNYMCPRWATMTAFTVHAVLRMENPQQVGQKKMLLYYKCWTLQYI